MGFAALHPSYELYGENPVATQYPLLWARHR
jgi:hypothetical protein